MHSSPEGTAQPRRTKHVIIVTLDGLRWQEVFRGADARILDKRKYVSDIHSVSHFDAPSHDDRRRLLMPFLWNVIARRGQIYGNRSLGSKVHCENRHHLSYPGYNELLAGYEDARISSNRLVDNRNSTVLDFVNSLDRYRGKVAVFSSWDAFAWIVPKRTSSPYVECPPPGEQYPDSVTFRRAWEYLQEEKPSLMMISFLETDDHGHGGRYGKYLEAANDADRRIGLLWELVQSLPEYRDQTTLIITTDHGRGKWPHIWTRHRRLSPGSGQVWFAVMGPDTPAFGEMRVATKLFLAQLAGTVGVFLGVDYYNPRGKVAPPVQTTFGIAESTPPTTISKEQ